MTTSYTSHYRLPLPDFDVTPWHDAYYQAMRILDGLIYGLDTGNAGSVWQNATVYATGQRAIDATDSTVWTCQVDHTSAAGPTTFAADRAAHPTYWALAFTISASVVSYDNISSGLTSTDVQGAIDEVQGNLDAAIAGLGGAYQPIDADLTAIAALATTVFGRSLLTTADAAALRTVLGLVIGTNVQAFDSDLNAIAALAGTGIAVRSAANTWVQRLIAAGTGVSVTNGDGAAGNPSIGLTAFGGDAGAGGTIGAVPAPGAGDAAANKFLHAGGLWQAIAGGFIKSVKLQVFTGSGTYTPNAGMAFALMFALGGGGGSGGAGSVASGAGGAGAGSEAWKLTDAATVGASQSVTIGAAGAAGSSGPGNGGNGGDTSIGAIVVGKGGSLSTASTASPGTNGGLGGVAGTGDIAGTGAPGDTGTPTSSGFGGSSRFGGGGRGRSSNGAGQAASGYGAGAGGAYYSTGGASAGAAGTAGLAFVLEFCTQ